MKKTPLLIAAGLIIAISVRGEGIPVKPRSLTLSPVEIAKLNQLFPASEEDAEHVMWDKNPINVILPVGKERLVTFPEAVDFGFDASQLSADKLTTQNNNGTLYLTAHAEFTPQRVQARLVNTGKIILLNLSAKKSGSKKPMVVSTLDNPTATSSGYTVPVSQTSLAEEMSQRKPIGMTALTRYAVQQLYAPKRLMPSSSYIFRTPMKAHSTEPLITDSSVIAEPLASWRGDNLYVTAVLLRNQLTDSLELDPRRLCGNWKATTFFPRNVLSAKGSMNDSTTVFLISDKAFGQVMKACHPERGAYVR